jgi:hypothetical protein
MSMQAIVVGLVLAAHSHQRRSKGRLDHFAEWLSFIARFSVVGEPPAIVARPCGRAIPANQ